MHIRNKAVDEGEPMPRDDRPVFAAPYGPDEAALRPALLAAAASAPDAEARAEAIGRDLVGAIRAARHGLAAASTSCCTPIPSRPRRGWR